MAHDNSRRTADEIALDAVAQFCDRPRAMRADIARLGDLVLPLLDAMSDAGRRRIAAMLCDHAFAPKSLLRALCDFPVEVCSSILTRSKRLNNAELLAIVSQHGAAHARAIARRSELDDAVACALRAMDDAGVDRALDLRQRPRPDAAPAAGIRTPVAPGRPENPLQAILRSAPSQHALPLRRMTPEAVIALAGDDNANLLHTAIADSLAITVASAAALCSAPSSKNMLYLLRFLGMDGRQAREFFAALAPDLAADDEVTDRFAAVYEQITDEQAAARVRAWRSDDLVALAREALAANEPELPEDEDSRVA